MVDGCRDRALVGRAFGRGFGESVARGGRWPSDAKERGGEACGHVLVLTPSSASFLDGQKKSLVLGLPNANDKITTYATLVPLHLLQTMGHWSGNLYRDYTGVYRYRDGGDDAGEWDFFSSF